MTATAPSTDLRTQHGLPCLLCVPGLTFALIERAAKQQNASGTVAPVRFEGPGLAHPAMATVATGVPAWRHGCLDDAVWDSTLGAPRPPTRPELQALPVWEIIERYGVPTSITGWPFARANDGVHPSNDSIDMNSICDSLGTAVADSLKSTSDRRYRAAAIEAAEAWHATTRRLGELAASIRDEPDRVWFGCLPEFAPLQRNGLVDGHRLATAILQSLGEFLGGIQTRSQRALLVIGAPACAAVRTKRDPGPGPAPHEGVLLAHNVAEAHIDARAPIRDVDIAPTLLAWLGIPPAADLPGRVFIHHDRGPAEAAVFTYETAGDRSEQARLSAEHPESLSIQRLQAEGYRPFATAQDKAYARALSTRVSFHAACSYAASGNHEGVLNSLRTIQSVSSDLEIETLRAHSAFVLGEHAVLAESIDRLETLGIDTVLMQLARLILNEVGAADDILVAVVARIEGGTSGLAMPPAEQMVLAGLAAERLGCRDHARVIFTRATELDGGAAAAWAGAARAHLADGNAEAAYAPAKQSASTASSDADRYDAFAVLGESASRRGDYDAAAHAFQDALGIRPESAAIREQLVATLRHLNRHNEAMRIELGGVPSDW
ncbi:MAG: alkaline phosphatase family protein [Planctomycetota bacterium]